MCFSMAKKEWKKQQIQEKKKINVNAETKPHKRRKVIARPWNLRST